MSDRKRKATDSEPPPEDDGTSPMSPVLRAPLVQGRSAARPQAMITAEARYYYDNCLTMYEQLVERLNEAFKTFLIENPDVTDLYWHCAEYRRNIFILKQMFQCPFPGRILTCGWHGTESLGYDDSTTIPRLARAVNENPSIQNIVKIACKTTYTLMLTRSGQVFAFGSQDEGGMGRGGEAHEGDLRITGFIPHPSVQCPVKVEDGCIIMVEAGYAKSLYLSLHNNVYTSGCFRDYDDKKIREKPFDVNKPDKNRRKFPFGSFYEPTHLYEMPPGAVKDMACGNWMAACIVGEDVVTWGVGTRGELGRPLSLYSDTGLATFENEEKVYPIEKLKNEFLKPTICPAIKGLRAISVACGQGHLMVVARAWDSLDSTVFGSGLNQDGQLGLNDFKDRKVLTPLEYTKTNGMMISKVECGKFHTLALSLDTKSLYACGQNIDGQCGVYAKEDPNFAKQIPKLQRVLFPDDDLAIDQIACGEAHNLVIARPRDGYRQVYTWGSAVPGEEEDANPLGLGAPAENTFLPRELILQKSDGTRADANGAVWRQVQGGSQHSTFLFSSAPKKKKKPRTSFDSNAPTRDVLRNVGS